MVNFMLCVFYQIKKKKTGKIKKKRQKKIHAFNLPVQNVF